MVHGKNRIPYWIDRRLTGLVGPEYHATISFGLPFELGDFPYGKSPGVMVPASASDQPSCRYTHRDRIPRRGGADGVSGRNSYRWWHDPLVEARSSHLSCTRPPERIGTTVASAVLAPPSRVGWTRSPSSCHGSTTGRYCPRRSEGMGFCWTDGHSARKRVARRDDLRWVTPAGDLTTRLNRACTHQPQTRWHPSHP